MVHRKFLSVLLFACITTIAVAKETHYIAGSEISTAVTVTQADGTPRSLRALIQEQAKPLNIVFVFGGGGLGHERTRKTGGLWCPDSYEDLHILRSLIAAYGDQIGVFPIAIPPAHHTAHLGLGEGVFLKPDINSLKYQQAVAAFVSSTLAAFESGTIPVQPLFDTRYNLLASAQDLASRESSESWHGAFRAADERQTYGVPSLWIVSQDGRVLKDPFRGNLYHPHGEGIVIRYTLTDVVQALNSSAP